jgi:hypothetical protein
MTQSSSYSGLEVFYHAFKSQIKRDADALVLFVHWYLVKHGFACITEGRVIHFDHLKFR